MRSRYLLTVSEVLPKFRIGSIDFTAARFVQATQEISRLINNLQVHGTAVHFANAYNIALAEHDEHYQELMNKGDYVFTDGTPVVWAGKRLHAKQDWERVYGPDVTEWILHNSDPEKTFHYFLGSTPETMEKLQSEIKNRYPAAHVVGFDCPPFRKPTESELSTRDQRIKDSGATVVWVGLGTPKQDYEAQRIARALPVTAIAVGAAFDFIAQTVPQAPKWMQSSGLEWSYRLAREPRRLAKRYFWGNPQFIRSVIKNRS
jgi:N-acetylglucosaminyldiphosphoundecaprenol N-acetyl-beta-D-mannosaminyltransferase